MFVARSSPVEAGGTGNESQTGSRIHLGQVTLKLRPMGQGRVNTLMPEPSSRTAAGSLHPKYADSPTRNLSLKL